MPTLISNDDPEAIAAYLVDAMRKTIGPKGSSDDMATAIAKMIADRFAEADEHTVKQALRIASEFIREHRLAEGIDLDMGLRPVSPIKTTHLDIGMPENEMPVCEIVDPASIWIDGEYQRDVTNRGRRKIDEIVEAFDWNRFSPPKCTYTERAGKRVLVAFDGQHTSIAAASHPGVRVIPVMVYKAPTVAGQADGFVGANSGHLVVSPLQLFQAELVAGNEDALTIKNVCDRVGITVLKYPGDKHEPGDTVAIGEISKLVARRGAKLAGDILDIPSRAKFAPVTATQIRAAEFLFTDKEFRGLFKPTDIIEAITGHAVEMEKEARIAQATNHQPLYKWLGRTWFKHSKKRRPAVRAVA